MKITVDLRPLIHLPWSGVGQSTAKLATLLFKEQPQTDWRIFYNSWRQQPQLEQFIQNNLLSHGWPNKFLYFTLFFFNQPNLDDWADQPDIFWSPNLDFINQKKENSQTKRVVTIHDLSFLINPKWYDLKSRLWHKMLLKKKLERCYDYFVAVSESTKKDLINLLNIPAEKIKVIYHGVEEVFFQPISDSEKSRIINKYNLPANYFLFLGNVEPRKNIKLLIQALGQLKKQGRLADYHLVIAGQIKDKSILNEVTEQNLLGKVNFLNYVPDVDRPGLYQLAQAFVFPSHYEGFGLPILEAAASKCLVISSNQSSLPELLGDQTLYFNPKDLDSLVKLLAKVIMDCSQFNSLIQGAFERSQQFSWSKAASELYNYFKEIYENRN